ncbi:HAD-IA family hydrolase [Salinirubellus salinus]|uniref:HAD-IA family hydrolase n=1 Tax=Salinirubellus salinus TaxID=1364945 RepID=A0A9E7R6L7_9EURY|nr:HAD-IA family hydrolase [Salinirubellus salinus]UWM56562.1 HAD-IA family hydrolase [Salinirubellus salinus]
MYDGVIFDNDGVLVPACAFSVFREAAHRTFDSFGVDPAAEEVRDVAAVADPDRVREICATHGLDPDTFWARRDRNNHLAQRREVAAGRKVPYEDTGVALSLDVPTGIVSSNQHETIEFLVDRFGWEFGTYYGREHTLAGVERKKPNTHYVDRAMDDLAVSNPLFVGDSESDVRVAENAGLDSVFLRREHRAGYDLSVDPTYELGALADLPSLL